MDNDALKYEQALKRTIDILRCAAASVWTECEEDEPNVEDIQQIADEALKLTTQFARPGKNLTLDGTGLDGWTQYLEFMGLKRK